MLFFPLITAVALFAFGFYALRQNPSRPTNRVLAVVCFVSAVSLMLQFIARVYGDRYLIDHVSNPMPWVRVRLSVIGLLCPFLVWVCYYVISRRYTGRHDLIRKLTPWAVISLFLMIIPFTEAFKPSASRPGNILHGPLYTVYLVVMLGCLVTVCVSSIVVARKLSGIRQLEFRFITLAFGYLSLAIIFGTLVYTVFRWRLVGDIVRSLSFLVFLAFGVSAWSVTSRRIYQSSQVFLGLAERFAVVAVVAFPTMLLLKRLPAFDRSLWASAGVVAFACLGYYYLDNRARALLHLTTEQRATAIAKRLRVAASTQSNPDDLLSELSGVLSAATDGTRVRILTPEQGSFVSGEVHLTTAKLTATSLLNEGWVSVVSLARTTTRDDPVSLRAELEAKRIHLLVGPHWDENEPGVLIAFDERENGVPFTYPEIKTLRQLADIVDGLYTRCRFSLQARQAEQLATIGLIGAGLAHELRNPIVAIETFAQLLPERLDDRSFLQEFAEVIPGEARRIQALAEQLLDLSRPRKYEFGQVDVHEVIAETVFLLRKKANDSRVKLTLLPSASHRQITADPHALRQVLLNLILNSIQSIAATNQDGMITIRTDANGGAVTISIVDSGPGIPESVRARLFRPFASAGKERGLGLGLSICAEIVRVHRGTISAESGPAGGAVFRVILPLTTVSASSENAAVAVSYDNTHHLIDKGPSWLGAKFTGKAK